VDVPGGPWEEAHATRRPTQAAWLHTAWALGSWLLLWVDFGPRTQAPAAVLSAQVVARVRPLPRLLTEGGKAYTAARLQVGGVGYRPRRRGTVGRTPPPRLVAPQTLFYAQGVKVRDQAGPRGEVRRRVVCGGPRRGRQP
jgi:hypothetical protein